MKHKLLLFLTLFFTGLTTFGQSNQVQFTYKEQAVSGILKTSLNNLEEEIVVKEEKAKETTFKIAQLNEVTINDDQYVNAKVQYDENLTRNPANYNHISEPNYTESWLLLKVVVEGDYNLYQYSSSNFSQFYYQDINTKEIKPLIFKEYLVSANQTKKNNRFRNQLYKDIPLASYGLKDYQRINYSQSHLIRYFNKLNGYEEEKGIEKMNFKVSVFAGILNNFQKQLDFSPAAINSLYLNNYEFEKKTPLLIGLSGEIFVDKKEVNAVFVEIGFTQYRTDYYLGYYSKELSKVNFEFQSNVVLFNFGYKRYFNLSTNSQLYALGSFAANFFFTTKNEVSYHLFLTGFDHLGNYYEGHYDQVMKREKNFSNVGGKIALGYKFKKNYFIEADYHFGFSEYRNGVSYNMTSFKLGYSF